MDEQLEEAYTIFQKDIVKKLEDREWFIECITFNYGLLASKWGCSAIMSVRRLGEAFDFCREDHTRTLAEGIATSVTLDHFKQASFIAFWLRRMLPINQTLIVDNYRSVSEAANANEDQRFFLRYGNEICALLIGFQLCLFYEICPLEEDPVVLEIPNRTENLKQYSLPQRTIADLVMVLKHKNMSPHALYLLYKSLFTNILPGSRD